MCLLKHISKHVIQSWASINSSYPGIVWLFTIKQRNYHFQWMPDSNRNTDVHALNSSDCQHRASVKLYRSISMKYLSRDRLLCVPVMSRNNKTIKEMRWKRSNAFSHSSDRRGSIEIEFVIQLANNAQYFQFQPMIDGRKGKEKCSLCYADLLNLHVLYKSFSKTIRAIHNNNWWLIHFFCAGDLRSSHWTCTRRTQAEHR